MTRAALLLVLFVLCGCASQPISISDASAVPASRILAAPAGETTNSANSGELVVVRDPIRGGKGPALRLSINGQAVASMEPAELYTVRLSVGEYIVSIVPVPNRLSQFTSNSAAVTIVAGKTYTLRAGYAPGNFFLQPVAL